MWMDVLIGLDQPLHRLRRIPPQVRYDWTRNWHPPQSHRTETKVLGVLEV